jgi:RNA polymerase subunit RPABC4/transcription elongation factor Spt4
MKKVFIPLLLLLSTLMLSSCQVNWFGSHFDVPWYFIAAPVFILSVVLYCIMISKTYVCPKCKTEFKPKWYQIYITIHCNGSRIAKCPNCGRKGFCEKKE